MSRSPKLFITLFASALSVFAIEAQAQSWQGYGEMTAGPPGILFVAEPAGAGILAVAVPQSAAAEPAAYNLTDAGARIAAALGVAEPQLRIADLAAPPGAERAFVSGAVISENGNRPFLVSIDAGGWVEVIDVAAATRSQAPINDLPDSDQRFWGETPPPSRSPTYSGTTAVSTSPGCRTAASPRRCARFPTPSVTGHRPPRSKSTTRCTTR